MDISRVPETIIDECRKIIFEYQRGEIQEPTCLYLLALKLLSGGEYDVFRQSVYVRNLEDMARQYEKESIKITQEQFDRMYEGFEESH